MSHNVLVRSAILVAVGAFQAFAESPPPPPSAAVIQRGKVAFRSSCGFCHGDDATGNRAPDLIRSAVTNRDRDGNLLGPLIRNGRPDKGMPAFANLKESQVKDIVAFLHGQAEAALNSAGVPDDYPLRKLLTGDAGAGKSYFNGTGGCSGCHSATGDLAGVAKKYKPVDLQQRLAYPWSDKPVTATVTLPGGEVFEGKLKHDDEFEIAIVTSDGWYRSWPRDKVKADIHDPLAAHRALIAQYTDADMHNLFAYLETLK